MHAQICDQTNANFPVQMSGVNVVALYDTGTNMSHMSYACYAELKELSLIKMISALSVHLASSHDLCPIGLTCCEVTISKLQLRYTFIVCNELQEDLVFVLDVKHLHHLGCD